MGGSATSTTKVPKWQEDAAIAALNRSQRVADIGFAPYFGPDVAALTPLQLAAMRGTNQAASAFGVPTADLAAGLPVAQDYNGMQAYSSGGLYDQAVNELRTRHPEQYAAIMAQFGHAATPTEAVATPETRDRNSSSSSSANTAIPQPTQSGGGFTSLRDMFDGGGPGASGSTYRGGPLSGILNGVGIRPSATTRPATTQPASRPTVSRPTVSRPATTTSPAGRPTRGF